MQPDQIYYEPAVLNYPLGLKLRERFREMEWIPIENHNNIESLRKNPNTEFTRMKRHLVVGVRKSLRHTPNHKISDFLVPYTSSGCSAMCLYCYLVCNYNKCAYLRLFVNREQMMDKMLRAAQAASRDLVFEIGSNSDLVLENTLTDNLPWTIEHFGRVEKGFITFPTKFDTVEPMLGLNHRGRTLFRMSVNPEEIIRKVEFGTSPLEQRLSALNRMYQAGYRIGLLIAPVVLVEGWKMMYARLIDRLADQLPEETRKALSIEIIFMTYSYVHRAINAEAFPQGIELYDPERMTGRGRGKYRYREAIRAEGEAFLRAQLSQKLSDVSIAYIV